MSEMNIEVMRWTVTVEMGEDRNVIAQVESGHKFGGSITAKTVAEDVANAISVRLTSEILDKMAEEGVVSHTTAQREACDAAALDS